MFKTGELQKKMDLKISGSNVDIFSNDPKSDEKKGSVLSPNLGDPFGINKNIQPISEQIVTSTFFGNVHSILFK